MLNDRDLTPPVASEPLPPELEDLGSLLSEDAVEWQQRVPPTEPFAHRMRQALLLAEASAEHMSEPAESVMQRAAHQESSAKPPQPARRVPFPLAAVATLIVVALLAGIFAALGQNRTKLGGETATATITATMTATPHNGLVARAPLTDQPGVPVVAPSDPRVIYEYADNDTGGVLQRSEDGGMSWTQLPYPTLGRFVGAVALAVNPADARNVFLLVIFVDGPYPNAAGECPAGTTGGASAQLPVGGSQPSRLGSNLPGSGGYSCNNMYASEDGGSHWSQVHLLVAGTLFQTGITYSYDTTGFQAQGDTLYGRAWQLNSNSSFSQTGDIRIVRSDDKGQTWSDADATLQSQVGHICTYAATPQGTMVFAVVSTAGCWDGVQGAYSLWRSDDGGGHWSRAGDLFANGVQPIVVLTAAGGGGSAAVVYLWTETSGFIETAQVQASADGGQTWSASPSDGLPQGARLLAASQTPLSDGSLVAAFTTSPSSLTQHGNIAGPVRVFAWRPGMTAWRAVTSPVTIAGSSIANLYVSTSQPLTVTISVKINTSSNPRYTLIPLA